MINCGASLDIGSRISKITEQGNKKYYLLFDSHRPIHHLNLQPKKYLWIIDDGTIDRSNCPTDMDMQVLNEVIDIDKDEKSDEESEYEIDESDIKENMKKFENLENNKEEEKVEKTLEIPALDNSERPLAINQTIVDNKKIETKNEKEDSSKEEKEDGKEEENEAEEIQIGKKRIKRKIQERKEKKLVQQACGYFIS